MLQRLRQYRRPLAGSIGSLLAAAWLSLTLTPCMAMAASVTSAAHDGPTMHHAGDEGTTTSTHCPHCDDASSPCASMEAQDCQSADALPAAESENVKPGKFAAIPVDATYPALPARVPLPPGTATGPPRPPCTQLFCRFRE